MNGHNIFYIKEDEVKKILAPDSPESVQIIRHRLPYAHDSFMDQFRDTRTDDIMVTLHYDNEGRVEKIFFSDESYCRFRDLVSSEVYILEKTEGENAMVGKFYANQCTREFEDKDRLLRMARAFCNKLSVEYRHLER